MRANSKMVLSLSVASVVGYLSKRTFFGKYLESDEILSKRLSPIKSLFESSKIPQRVHQMNMLKKREKFDILVIGAGASGAGCALDAATRGLKTALIDKTDFAGETSSKSTKLIHGGVRYLEKAFLKLDYEQYKMVAEALDERYNLICNSPHTSSSIATIIPVFGSPLSYWKLFYYYFGVKAYDLVAGKKLLAPSRILTSRKTKELFPTINTDMGLLGSILYYDGQHNDSRTNIELVLTAAMHGATVCNYVELLDLKKAKKEDKNQNTLAVCRDLITGENFEVEAKCIINASGPYTDKVRKMSDPNCNDICEPSRGTHISISEALGPDKGIGILQPNTSDGRVVFILPWEGSIIAGTTDIADKPDSDLQPTSEEVDFILQEMNNLLDPKFRINRDKVKSAWTGLRPLIKDPSKTDTQSLVRNHLVITDKNGLVSITGGKWTTYRSMAQETIDEAIKHFSLESSRNCITKNLPLHGSINWKPNMDREISLKYDIPLDTARYLATNYGDQSFIILENLEKKGRSTLTPLLKDVGNKFFEEEIEYICQYEMAETVDDIISRRMRISFTNRHAAEQCVSKVAEIMQKVKGWNKEEHDMNVERINKTLKIKFNVPETT